MIVHYQIKNKPRAILIGDVFPQIFWFCEFCIKGWRCSVTIVDSGYKQPWQNRDLLALTCLEPSEENLEEDPIARNQNYHENQEQSGEKTPELEYASSGSSLCSLICLH